MSESTDVRLARIEEGQKALAQRIDLYHASITKKIETTKTTADNTALDVALMKRDRWWIGTISSIFGGALALIVEWFRK